MLIRYPDQDRITAYYDIGDTRERLCGWLQTHGVDPEEVRDRSTIVIQDGQLTVVEVALDGRTPCQREVLLRQDPPQAFVTASPEVSPGVLGAAANVGRRFGGAVWVGDDPVGASGERRDLSRRQERRIRRMLRRSLRRRRLLSWFRSLSVRLRRQSRTRALALVSVRVSAEVSQYGEAMRRVGEAMTAAAGSAAVAGSGASSLSRVLNAERDAANLRAVCADEAMFERALASARERGMTAAAMARAVASGRFTADGWDASTDVDNDPASPFTGPDYGAIPEREWQVWGSLPDATRRAVLEAARGVAAGMNTTQEGALTNILSVMDTPEVDHAGEGRGSAS